MAERVLTRDNAKSLILTNTEKLKLPNDYTVIGEGALAGFSQVKELTIHEGVSRVCAHAFFMRSFKNASGLERIIINSSATQFDPWAFYDCSALKTVFLPEDFPEQLAMELFFHTPSVTLNFGKKLLFAAKTKTVQQVMDETSGILMSGAAGMLPFRDGVLEIPASYFAIAPHAARSLTNKKIRKVVLPAGMRLIAPQVFADLPDLEEVEIADGATHIDNAVFARCKNLKTVHIPASVKRIGAGAFMDCAALETIALPTHLAALEDEVLSGCAVLQGVQLPDGISKVGAGAFANCAAIRAMVLPDSVKTIGTGAFWECVSLQQLYIAPATEVIQPSALGNCPALSTVYMPHIIHDALEMKRVFGENASPPDIHWITEEDEKPAFAVLSPAEATAALDELEDIVVPEASACETVADAQEAASEQPRTDADSVRRLEETIAAMQEKIEALSSQNTQAAAAVQQPAIDAGAIEALNANLAAIHEKFDSISGMQDSVAAITAMQEQVASIAAMQETVHERVGAISEIQEKMSEIDDIRARVDAIQPDALGDMQQRVSEISDIREKIDAISDIQEKVSAISDMQEKVSEISEIRQKIDAISDIQQKVDAISDVQEKVDAISDIQQKVSAISEMQEKVDAIADIRQKVDAISDVQEKVDAISDIQQKVSAIPDVQEKVDAIADIQQKVGAISDMQEKVDAISDIRQKVDAITDVQEKVGAISDIQQKVGAITDVQEKVGAISDVQEKVSEISTTQADINQRFAEMTGKRVHAKDTQQGDEELFDSAFVPVRRGNYRKDDRVFTYEISKPVEGPKQRSLMLKDFTVIAFRSFREKEGGERFEIPEGVRRVESQAFWSCPRLLALELPHSLTEVEPDAFSGCSRLNDVYLCEEFPERRAAEYFMFRPETKLHWPKKSLLSKARIVTVAQLLEGYEDVLTAEKVKKLIVANHVLQIPEGYTIIAPDMAKGIQTRADDPEHCLETIVLPKSMRRIGARAFAGLETLRHIVMSKGLQILDMNAFTGCTGPYRLVLPNGVSYIGPYAFSAPCRFEQIRLPKRLPRLFENTFSNCDSLASLRIPAAVQEIGDCALSGCSALTSLTLPKRFSEDLKRILDGPVKLNVTWTEDMQDTFRNPPHDAFRNILTPPVDPLPSHRIFTKEIADSCNTFQEKIDMLRSRPYVGANSLADMANQTKFEIPLGVLRLCSYAFGHNTRLLTLTIPKAIQVFEYAAFYGLMQIRDVFLPDEFDRDSAAVMFMNHPQVLLNIGGSRPVRVRQVLHDCPWVLSSNDISDLSVRNGVMTIPNGYMVISSFVYHGIMGMTHLRCLQIPPSARIIGYHAFAEQEHLEEVICAEGLLAVEPHAFVNCHSLRKIVLPSTLRFLGSNPFMGCMQLETIVLPRSFADREEELRRDCPHLKIQWCEDFDEDTRPSVVVDYSDIMQDAVSASVEMLTPFDEADIPLYDDSDADFDQPIEAALLSEETIQQQPEAQTIESAVSGRAMLEDHSVADAVVNDSETDEGNQEGADDMAEAAEIAAEDTDEGAQDLFAAQKMQGVLSDSDVELSLDTEDTEAEASDALSEAEPDAVADAMSALADALFGGVLSDATLAEEPTKEEDAHEPGIIESTESVTKEPIEEQVSEEVSAEVETLADALFAEESSEESGESENGDVETAEPVTEELIEEQVSEEVFAEVETLADAIFAEKSAEEARESDIGDVETAVPVTEEPIEEQVSDEASAEVETLADAIFAEESAYLKNTDEALSQVNEEESISECGMTAEQLVIPEDGRLTAKESRRIYHGETEWFIPSGYREIRAGACAALEDLTVLHIADTIERIGNGAFADCTALRSVTIPLSVKVLEEDAFDGCEVISAVTAPEVMHEQIVAMFGEDVSYVWLKELPKIIGDGRFTAKIRNAIYHDEPELVIPEGYLEIRAGACAGLEDMTRLVLPSTLVRIAAGAFADCTALETVDIPDSVSELAEDAFEGCVAIRRITAPKHLEAVIRANFPDVLLLLTEFE